MTTKIKKKGVLAYQEAPQRKNSSRLWLQEKRGSLQLKSTNPLQGTETCSWPKINLAVPFSQKKKNTACNKLDFGMQKILFYTLQGLGSLRLFTAGLAYVDSRRDVCSWPWENDAVQSAESQQQFRMWGQLPFKGHV